MGGGFRLDSRSEGGEMGGARSRGWGRRQRLLEDT